MVYVKNKKEKKHVLLTRRGCREKKEEWDRFFHCLFSFVLPPTEDYWYWRFSGARPEDEPFTHSGSSKLKVMVGKINNFAWIFTNFLLQSECPFLPLTFLFSLPLPPTPTVFLPLSKLSFLLFLLFRAPSPRCMVQQCHLWWAERHFTLSHLPIWICVTMPVYV